MRCARRPVTESPNRRSAKRGRREWPGSDEHGFVTAPMSLLAVQAERDEPEALAARCNFHHG